MANSIFEAIKNRRSVYPDQFTSRSITRLNIETLLKAANCAPSHKKTYPWRFKVFFEDSLDLLVNELPIIYKQHTPSNKFSEFKQRKISAKIEKSVAVIAICMQRDLKSRIPEWEEIAVTAMAVQNLWVSLDSLGLGGYWSSPSYVVHMRDFLALEEGERCLGFMYLGGVDPLSENTKKKVNFNDNVRWI